VNILTSDIWKDFPEYNDVYTGYEWLEVQRNWYANKLIDIAEERDRLRERLRLLTDGLQFYAKDINWLRYDGKDAKLIREDRGWRARQALQAAAGSEGAAGEGSPAVAPEGPAE
jgi:hypothetical protein